MKKLQLKRILVPIDFSAVSLTALDQAIFTARLFKADLYLMHVIEIPQTIYSIENPALPGIDLSALNETMEKKMDEVNDSIRKKHGIRIRTVVTHGKTAPEIVSFVKENKIDLVYMGTHGVSGFDEVFIGSNAHRVVTMCPCPVITVQRKMKKAGFSDILLPIDNTLHSREKLNYVLVLAQQFGSTIHILGLPDDDDALHLKQFKIKLASVEKAIKKAGLACTMKIVKGNNLAELALKHAAKLKADLIAIMTENESRYGIFIGPFAKQVVNHSRIPVLSIKPTEGSYESVDLAAASPF
jgi:nucleotide-binding universal stress UspA family protein